MTGAHDLRFDSGRVCLDLLATVGFRLSAHPVERLDSACRLAEWLRGTGVVPADEPLRVDERALAEFTGLRDVVHRVVHGELDGRAATAADIGQLNRLATAGPPASRLIRSGGELRRRLDSPPRLEQLLAVVSEDLIRLLGSPERAFMRECGGPGCDLVYLDTSRGRRRRWCSADACGNRYYVASHRARKANAAQPG